MKKEVNTNGERDVDILLEKFRNEVEEIRKGCLESGLDLREDLGYDEIFLLRFWLSWGSVLAAVNAVQEVLQFRENHAWRLAKRIPGRDPLDELDDYEYAEVIQRIVPRGIHGKTKDGDVLFLIRAGIMKSSELFQHGLPKDAVEHFLTYSNDVIYNFLDLETRRTRRLTKVLLVNDLNGVSLASIDIRFVRALGASSKVSDLIHPQLTYRNVIVNPPAFIKILTKTFLPFMSKRAREKMVICTGSKPWGLADLKACPYVTSVLDVDHIPTYLGGGCECAAQGGCCRGFANEMSKK
mmetsp:Transcript_11386/g.23041  ORF Transcript_11386/g.23041 Transcript_11386/m.23041 type:complete len:296 (-) Transcript_11386:2091-2978(-)